MHDKQNSNAIVPWWM